MSAEKPNWAAMVKESSARKGIFSESMKQAVLARVEQNHQRRQMGRPLFYIAASLLGLMICVLILPVFNRFPAALGIAELGRNSAITDSEAAFSEEFTLNYEPAKDLALIPVTDKGVRSSTLLRLPLASVRITGTASTEGLGTYMDYEKPGEEGTAYFGFQLANHFSSSTAEFYEIGYGKMSEVKFQESNAFGLANLRMDGKCGPERRCVYWIDLKQDQVVGYEQTDAETIYEQDLDGDGVTEAIVSTHDKDLYIYKNVDGQVQSVHVPEALKAGYGEKVSYNPDNRVFELNGRGEVQRYRYAAGADKLRSWREEGN